MVLSHTPAADEDRVDPISDDDIVSDRCVGGVIGHDCLIAAHAAVADPVAINGVAVDLLIVAVNLEPILAVDDHVIVNLSIAAVDDPDAEGGAAVAHARVLDPEVAKDITRLGIVGVNLNSVSRLINTSTVLDDVVRRFYIPAMA